MDRPPVAARSVAGNRSRKESAENYNSTAEINNSRRLPPCHFSDLIEIADIDRNRDVWRIAVI
jgi:hypothetical protein